MRLESLRLGPVRALAGALLAIGVAPPASAADPPNWLLSAARLETSTSEAKADAVVLHDDVQVTVSDDGRVVTRRAYAVRVLTRDGQGAAAVREVYETDGGDVRTMRAWILTDGRTVELGRDDSVDLSLADNDIYNESRVRVLAAGRAALPGVVFGAETEVSERIAFTQVEWALQQAWPVRSLRRSLTLPPGATARSVTFNAAPIEPVREGASYVWTARNLSGVTGEPSAPPLSAIVPRVSVTYSLESRRATAFESWAGVASWLDTLSASQVAGTPELVAKARALTAGAASDLDRVRAIGRFVQQVQYISVQTGIGRGGGYRPRAAAEVLVKNYGDCKDKANLMKALLAAVGLQAHIVAIYSGDPDYVRPDWPSPQQFNHAIAAVVLPAPVEAPAFTVDAALGNVLYFDPTDEFTPVGELPRYLQGSHGLVIKRDGALVRMPQSRPNTNPTIRRIEGTLTPEGGLTATIQHVTAGEPASLERQLFRSLTKDEYARQLAADAGRQIVGARLTLGQIGDDLATNRFELTMKLEALGFAQTVNRLLLVRPPQMIRLTLPELGTGPRLHPVQLDFFDVRDTFEVALPPGVSVDEMPESRTVTGPMGTYTVSWQAQGGRVVRTVVLQVPRATLPATAGPGVRAFFDGFREAERQPLVLLKP
jgi:transglutaminase-like putative cysteine protease